MALLRFADKLSTSKSKTHSGDVSGVTADELLKTLRQQPKQPHKQLASLHTKRLHGGMTYRHTNVPVMSLRT